MPESKNLQRLTKPEKPRNVRLCNNDKSALHLPYNRCRFPNIFQLENERYKFGEKLRKNEKKGIDFFSELSIIIFVR